jgi:hypothetical protein
VAKRGGGAGGTGSHLKTCHLTTNVSTNVATAAAPTGKKMHLICAFGVKCYR